MAERRHRANIVLEPEQRRTLAQLAHRRARGRGCFAPGRAFGFDSNANANAKPASATSTRTLGAA